MKTCSICKIQKTLNQFVRAKKSKDGRRCSCKECNKPLKQRNAKDYYKKHKETLKAKRNKNKKERALYDKEYREKNKDKIKEYMVQYRKKNKDKIKEIRKKNLNHYREYSKLYSKKKYYSDINFRLKKIIPSSLRRCIKKELSTSKYLELFGYTIDELIAHIEKLFKKGMSWSNYGKWHIDHIKPVCKFDCSKENELIKCWSLDNLQPLWALDNLKKGGK